MRQNGDGEVWLFYYDKCLSRPDSESEPVNETHSYRAAQKELAGNRRRVMRRLKDERRGLFFSDSSEWDEHRFVELRRMLMRSGKLELIEDRKDDSEEEGENKKSIPKRGRRPELSVDAHVASFDDAYKVGSKLKYKNIKGKIIYMNLVELQVKTNKEVVYIPYKLLK